MTAALGQLDLLALLEPDTPPIDDPADDAAAHLALFPRVWFRAAYETCFDKAGDLILGWQCPVCRGIEWGAAHLELNHGFWPGQPGTASRRLDEGTCSRIDLRRRQEGHGDHDGPAGSLPDDELDEAADSMGVVRLSPGEYAPSTDRVISGFGVCACGCSVLHHKPGQGGHRGPLGECGWCDGSCRECRPGATAR